MKKQNYYISDLSDCVRILSADAVELAGSGHPGMPLGMADAFTVLVFNHLRFNPNDPKWLNRDRLVLSAGHGSMLLYSFYYLSGYKDFNLDDIKNFRQLNSKTAGHPEYNSYEAIETTTGPLGQGLANAVGMAIAAKKYQSKLGIEICNYNVYVIVSDGCLMEGISYESISLSGHLKLDNLIVIFDSNKISIDGNTNLAVSENQIDKFKSMGFDVFSIDGHNYEEIDHAFILARKSKKPSLIICNTIIAKGSNRKAGSELSHGSPLEESEIEFMKKNIKFLRDSNSRKSKNFFIPEDLKHIWSKCWEKSKNEYDIWVKNFAKLPIEDQEYFSNKVTKNKINFGLICKKFSDRTNVNYIESTRNSSGKIIQSILEVNEKIICGSADLSLSNYLKSENSSVITAENFSGNFIHYGVREHAMSGAANGIALSGFLPICGTFFAFSDYMRPSVRLSAIMGLNVIYVMTHDSIAVGEDGPTHQPIEQLASFRAMPNINIFRPADFCETAECYEIALSNFEKPSIMVLTRQKVPQLRVFSKLENLSKKGAYIISESNNKNINDLVIFATGSELHIALDTKKILMNYSYEVRVVSVPCFDLFLSQDSGYIDQMIGEARLVVAIEAGVDYGWHKILGKDGMFFGLNNFGKSAPYDMLYKHFKLYPDDIALNIKSRLEANTKAT